MWIIKVPDNRNRGRIEEGKLAKNKIPAESVSSKIYAIFCIDLQVPHRVE
jgi:hypothetical protein